MKNLLPLTLLIASALPAPAAIIETISLNLSPLHTGSTLSGTFSLSNTPAPGDTASVLLAFSDPSDYSIATLSATISILSGTPSGFAVDFSPLSFTNLSGSTTPINTRDISLNRTAFAMCPAFPCTATGLFQDRSPAVFTGQYTISPAAAAVPEPAYTPIAALLLITLCLRRQVPRRSRV